MLDDAQEQTSEGAVASCSLGPAHRRDPADGSASTSRARTACSSCPSPSRPRGRSCGCLPQRFELRTTGALRLGCEDLSIDARGSVAICACSLTRRSTEPERLSWAGDRPQAHAVGIRVRLGDVALDANDNVRATGEKIQKLPSAMEIASTPPRSPWTSRASDLAVPRFGCSDGRGQVWLRGVAQGEVSRAAEQVASSATKSSRPMGPSTPTSSPSSTVDFAVMGCARPFPSVGQRRRSTYGSASATSRGTGGSSAIAGGRGPLGASNRFPPAPFTKMVLGYENAYGGKAIFHRREKVGCYENPDEGLRGPRGGRRRPGAPELGGRRAAHPDMVRQAAARGSWAATALLVAARGARLPRRS